MVQTDNKIDYLILTTSVTTQVQAQKVAELFDSISGIINWSIDIDDWQHVLRIEYELLTENDIRSMLKKIDVLSQKMPIW